MFSFEVKKFFVWYNYFIIWNEIHVTNSSTEIIYHVITMLNVGFLEEILFRGFLFKMMEKDNVKKAILVSSITFGIGHIVNLLNWADLLPTILQVCYAIAIGYMLVLVFLKSKSIIPYILFHGIFNALSIFNNGESQIWSNLLLIVLCLSYAMYINKTVKNKLLERFIKEKQSFFFCVRIDIYV